MEASSKVAEDAKVPTLAELIRQHGEDAVAAELCRNGGFSDEERTFLARTALKHGQTGIAAGFARGLGFRHAKGTLKAALKSFLSKQPKLEG